MSTTTIQELIPTQSGTKRDSTAKPETPIKKDVRQTKPLPAPNSDFYDLAATLPAEELAVLKQVRAFMETKVAPIITKYWVEDAFRLSFCRRSRNSASAALASRVMAAGA